MFKHLHSRVLESKKGLNHFEEALNERLRQLELAQEELGTELLEGEDQIKSRIDEQRDTLNRIFDEVVGAVRRAGEEEQTPSVAEVELVVSQIERSAVH